MKELFGKEILRVRPAGSWGAGRARVFSCRVHVMRDVIGESVWSGWSSLMLGCGVVGVARGPEASFGSWCGSRPNAWSGCGLLNQIVRWVLPPPTVSFLASGLLWTANLTGRPPGRFGAAVGVRCEDVVWLESVGPDGCVVHHGPDEVCVREVGAGQVRPAQVCLVEAAVVEVCVSEARLGRVGGAEVGVARVGAGEHGVAEVGLVEGGVDEHGFAEGDAGEVRVRQVCAEQVGAVEVREVQIDLGEVRELETHVVEPGPVNDECAADGRFVGSELVFPAGLPPVSFCTRRSFCAAPYCSARRLSTTTASRGPTVSDDNAARSAAQLAPSGLVEFEHGLLELVDDDHQLRTTGLVFTAVHPPARRPGIAPQLRRRFDGIFSKLVCQRVRQVREELDQL